MKARTYDRAIEGVRPPFDPSKYPQEAAAWNKVWQWGVGEERRGDPKRGRELRPCDARPVIVADDVAAAWAAGDGMAVEDFHCLAPPWPSFWIEYPSTSGAQRRGIWITDATRFPRAKGGSLQGAVDNAREEGYDGDLRWLIDVAVVMDDGRTRPMGPVGWVVLALDERGRARGNRWVLATPKGARTISEVQRLDGKGGLDPDWLMAAAMPAFQTVDLLHCRNVSTVEHRARPHEERRHLRRAAGGGSGLGDGMAGAHVVAGSKHHYGDCCPVDPAECPLAHGQQPCPRCGAHEPHGRLFGKLTGVYWVPGHARGNPRRGVVLTDWDLRVDGAA